ncbi:IS1182 family transposase [Sporolactobacillus sp. STSJ-5]|uniref:IS1182 family transposase n=1 Tax=Sporolactobacillus sp. STSJ-5 TaxID=2965076 RepID=UPI002102EED9|nr:IS1182 family transposase [Sporolactobacillus sp. STSJ-5]
MARALRENLPMMWLANQQTPDFRTINRFRVQQMETCLQAVFEDFIAQILEQGYISGSDYYLDGTKIEADANRYTFVWKKATQRYQAALQEKVRTVFKEINDQIKLDHQEIQKFIQNTKKAASAQEVEDWTKGIEEQAGERLKKPARRSPDRTLRKQVKALKNDFIPRAKKYEKQMETFGERNSYSKTDTDATFMRMKEDHMKNGQLKPGYNVQMGTENQMILFYTLHQNPTDTRTLIPHLKQLAHSPIAHPEHVIADAGYGSEANYLYLMEEHYQGLIPYNQLRQEEQRRFKKDLSKIQNWEYHELEDVFICPNHRKVVFKKYMTRTDHYGYKRDFKIYECEDCTDCPFKSKCTKAKGNRQVHYNPVYEETKAKARRALNLEEGRARYRRRKLENEPVFGNLKQNMHFRRFHLRGLKKVHVEFGLLALAHNLMKKVKMDFQQ